MHGLILIGTPGAGKGTLGEYIHRTYGYEHFSSGDLLRDEVRMGTPIGQKIRAILKEGGQVEDAIIQEMVFNRLNEMIANKQSFVMDGFPQTLIQKQSLDAHASKQPELHLHYITLCVEMDTARLRMENRISCEKCHAVFSKILFDGQALDKCGQCQISLTGRESDQGQKAANRLAFFAQNTGPILDSLLTQSPSLSIDANLSPKSVFEKMDQIMIQINQV